MKDQEESKKQTPQHHHEKAAEHHEQASKHHKEAGKCCESDDHKGAAYHAQIAQGHSAQAKEHCDESSKNYAQADFDNEHGHNNLHNLLPLPSGEGRSEGISYSNYFVDVPKKGYQL